MKILSLDINKFVTPKTTGYAAATAIGLSFISGVSKNKLLKKYHKPMAYASIVLTTTHIGLVEYNHYKWKNLRK